MFSSLGEEKITITTKQRESKTITGEEGLNSFKLPLRGIPSRIARKKTQLNRRSARSGPWRRNFRRNSRNLGQSEQGGLNNQRQMFINHNFR